MSGHKYCTYLSKAPNKASLLTPKFLVDFFSLSPHLTKTLKKKNVIFSLNILSTRLDSGDRVTGLPSPFSVLMKSFWNACPMQSKGTVHYTNLSQLGEDFQFKPFIPACLLGLWHLPRPFIFLDFSSGASGGWSTPLSAAWTSLCSSGLEPADRCSLKQN